MLCPRGPTSSAGFIGHWQGHGQICILNPFFFQAWVWKKKKKHALPWAALAALLVPQLLLKIGLGALGCGNEGAELPKRLARAREAKCKPSSGCELLLALHLAKHRGRQGLTLLPGN